MVDIVRSQLLGDIPHGFFGREGGVSTGEVSGLQCGFGADDDLDAVRQNRWIATEAISPSGTLVTPHQTHSADVMTVVEPWPEDQRPTADALTTNQPGLVLGIVTADCAPVLLQDEEAGVIAAAHAGWRGARSGVLENTIDAMKALGAQPNKIKAAIGPCIQQASYEVDDGFRQQFDESDSRFFERGQPGHWQFDLSAYAKMRIERASVDNVERLPIDTYTLESRYFSYRRATHRDEKTYGRQISLIAVA